MSSWVLEKLKTIQIANYDFYALVTAREKFALDEWIDVLMQTIGFDPESFGRRNELLANWGRNAFLFRSERFLLLALSPPNMSINDH